MRRLFFAPLLFFFLVGCSESTPRAWDNTYAKIECERRIKSLLRDPDSYQLESISMLENNGEYNQFGRAYIIYRAKNAFGGYVRGGAECEKYQGRDGTPWVKARLLEN